MARDSGSVYTNVKCSEQATKCRELCLLSNDIHVGFSVAVADSPLTHQESKFCPGFLFKRTFRETLRLQVPHTDQRFELSISAAASVNLSQDSLKSTQENVRKR